MAIVKNSATTAVASLARLEGGICEFLRKCQAGTLNPYCESERLSGELQHAELKKLGKRLGFRYATATLSGFERTDAEKQGQVLRRLAGFALRMPELLMAGEGGLFLFGPKGTGKDHLLAALMKIAIGKYGLSVEWWDGLALAAAFRRLIDSDRETESGLIRQLVGAHVLALSDPIPPRGELSQYQLSTLRDVIDRRYREWKATWITTNVDQQEASEELLTKPVMDRLKEGAALIHCDWPSYRERRKATW